MRGQAWPSDEEMKRTFLGHWVWLTASRVLHMRGLSVLFDRFFKCFARPQFAKFAMQCFRGADPAKVRAAAGQTRAPAYFAGMSKEQKEQARLKALEGGSQGAGGLALGGSSASRAKSAMKMQGTGGEVGRTPYATAPSYLSSSLKHASSSVLD